MENQLLESGKRYIIAIIFGRCLVRRLHQVLISNIIIFVYWPVSSNCGLVIQKNDAASLYIIICITLSYFGDVYCTYSSKVKKKFKEHFNRFILWFSKVKKKLFLNYFFLFHVGSPRFESPKCSGSECFCCTYCIRV